MQMHTQYQVILKPGRAIRKNFTWLAWARSASKKQHPAVEDKLEPVRRLAPGGWAQEVWLDGMEITQFTYFQPGRRHDTGAGQRRIDLTAWSASPCICKVCARSGKSPGTAGAPTATSTCKEIEHCTHNLRSRMSRRLKQMYNLYEAEASRAQPSPGCSRP